VGGIGANNVTVTAVSATQFNVTFTAALGNQNISSLIGGGVAVGGGASLIEQVPGNGTTNEVQRLAFVTPPAASDVFALNYDGRFTPNIVYGASSAAVAGSIQTALQTLPGFAAVGGGGVTVVEHLVGTGSTDEVQRLTFAVAPTATTKFALNYTGQYTTEITYGATPAAAASAIRAALEALPGIGVGNVTVVSNSATQFDITFTNSLGNRNIATLIDGGLIVGGGATVTEQTAGNGTTNEVQKLTFVTTPGGDGRLCVELRRTLHHGHSLRSVVRGGFRRHPVGLGGSPWSWDDRGRRGDGG